jgi:hypothetical protein
MAVGSILRPFGKFYGHLASIFWVISVIFSPFWHVVPRKLWQPWSKENVVKICRHGGSNGRGIPSRVREKCPTSENPFLISSFSINCVTPAEMEMDLGCVGFI